MNTLKGEISSIEQNEDLSLISVKLVNSPLQVRVLMLDFNALLMKVGAKVELFFKENELILAQENMACSIDNVFELELERVEQGELLVQIFFKDLAFASNLSAILTKNTALKFDLSANAKFKGFVLASDIVIKVL
ncbi:hypothetical protein DMB92_04500 [Campylobacter sp. MIT 99-7217]|uniref:hypothetical protein n=1 Tax=Campylobacter sp. MIT 99-7217 TaxID=535091 RepID=UPI00115766B5|nr:hypothetical protein [Campylobacter sp. MIT 99-7217]TQR32364.1 hypothetical protein DMB92_04500 [Campylobacter sp. MIT 99-7217]